LALADDATVVSVTDRSLSTNRDSTLVSYVVIELSVPRLPDNRVLCEAVLDLLLDVSSSLADSLSDGMVLLEVTRMPTDVNSELTVESLGRVLKKSVKVGDDRAVSITITSLLRNEVEQLGSEEESAGITLLVGAIEGGRYGRYTATALPGGGGAKAAITLRTQERYPGL
jgi:hypothetical protein